MNIEDIYAVMTPQVIIGGIVMTVAWIGVGIAIGHWIWGG